MLDGVALVDALAVGVERRLSTVDFIGAGPRTVAGVLEAAGVRTLIVPAEVVFEKPRVLEDFSVLFVSGMITDLPAVKRVMRIWKRRGGPIIVGGPISNAGPRLLALGADVVVFGEAEGTLVELLNKTSLLEGRVIPEELAEIRGLMFSRGGEVFFTGRRPPLSSQELASLRPSTELIRCYPRFWANRVYVEVTRGCSNARISPASLLRGRPYPGCAYCGVVATWGPSRSIPLDRIKRDIEGLIDEGVRRIVLGGSDFLDYGRGDLLEDPRHPPPNLEAVGRLLEEVFSIPEVAVGEVTVMIENLKPSTLNEEAATLLGSYLRGTSVNLGIETGDESLSKSLGRPFTVEEAIRAVSLLLREGMKPHVYLIYGLPGQTRESVEATLSLIDKLEAMGVEKITLYRFTPLPRTGLEDAEPGRPEDPLNRVLIKRVRAFNVKAKKRMIGEKLNVIVAAKLRGRYIAYPVKHGPVVEIPENDSPKEILGRRAKVLITDIVTDRMLRGSVITVGRPVAREDIWTRFLGSERASLPPEPSDQTRELKRRRPIRGHDARTRGGVRRT